jgi:4-amino-4-deoxy-L-arabinose transferase-like glycosyltransferase
MIAADSRATALWSSALALVAAGGLGALGIGLLDTVDGRPSSPEIIAAERSVVAAAAVVALAALSRLRASPALRWLAYAGLAVAGLKLVLEDLRVSPPLEIFVALGAYGAALIVAARLLPPPVPRRQSGADQN